MSFSVITYGQGLRRLMAPVCLFICLLDYTLAASAQKLKAPLPPRDGYVNDNAHLISEQLKANLEVTLGNLEQRTGLDFVIATVSDTGSQSADQYALILAKAWGVGISEQRMRGLLLLFSAQSGQYNLYWSQNIEADLPRAFLEEILKRMKEPLSHNDYDAAVKLAVRAIGEKLGAQFGFNVDELGQADWHPDPSSARGPPSPGPPIDSKKLFTLVLTLMGIVGGFIAAAVFVFWLASKLLSWGHKASFKPATAGLLLVAITAPTLVIFWLFPSQIGFLHSWAPHAGPFAERSFWAERVFGLSPNRYHVDIWGQITELHLTNAHAKSAAELPGLESLTKLTTLEISNSQLEGNLDLTPFRDLEYLDLHGTQISSLTGIARLKQLTTLDLSDTNITDLRGFEEASNLKEVRLSGLNMSTVTGLENLWQVKTLYLERCTGIDLNRVATLYQLEELSLNQTEIVDLSPLRSLGSLQRLWLSGSRVRDIGPLANLKLGLLDIRGTDIDPNQVARTFKTPVVVLYGEQDRALVQINPRAKAWIKPIFFGLLFLLLLLLWPVPKSLRRRPLMLLQHLGRRMIIGAFLVLLLLTLANLEWSFNFTKGFLPPIREKLILAAYIIGILWLIVRPIILLLLEIKAVGSSRWGVSLLTFSRMIPWIVIALPIGALIAWMFLYLAPRNTGIVHYLFLIFPILFCIGLLSPISKLVLPVFIWRRRIKRIRRELANDKSDNGLLLEIPLHYTSRSVIYNSFLGFARKGLEAAASSLGEQKGSGRNTVLNTFSVGLLEHIHLKSGAASNLRCAVVIIRFDQIEQARQWELQTLREWLISAYRVTWAPLWVVLDWDSNPALRTVGVERNIRELESLAPYVSGFVHHRLTGPSVMFISPPESISGCLKSNYLTDDQKLEQAGLKELLDESFTPVAALLRSVFSYPHLMDRLDLLMRATETAVAFFVLVLIVEHEGAPPEGETSQARKIDEAIRNRLKERLPDFSSWESVLNTFCKRSPSKLAAMINDAWSEPPSDSSFEIHEMIETVGGAGAAGIPAHRLHTRRESLTLLRLARNVITAHGPTIENEADGLYLTIFAVVLDLLSALPWRAVTLRHVGQDGFSASFRGCLPSQMRDPEVSNLPPGAYVQLQNSMTSGRTDFITAARYFYSTGDPISVAMHIGEQGFFDPIAGQRI